MTPTKFEGCNVIFKAPHGFSTDQIADVPGMMTQVTGASLDGATVCVVAWQPDASDLEQLNAGKPIFLNFIGGCPPHFPSTKLTYTPKT